MLGERLIREALDLQIDQTQKDQTEMTYERAVTEAELTASATAPRVTDDQVEAFIATEHYFTAADGVIGAASSPVRPQLSAQGLPKLEILTFCVLVLKNGFTVHGFSACADRSNFDPQIGRRIARANAKAHIWGHLGFELRTKLDMIERANAPSLPGMTTHVGTKVVHANPLKRGAYNVLRGWDVPENEDPNDDGYLVEYADGGEANVPGFFGYVSWSPADVFERSYGAAFKK